MANVLYRYESCAYSLGVDECDNPLPGYRVAINVHTHKILKATPKGVWIEWDLGLENKKRFVNLAARKQFACPTQAEALDSFKFRKLRQIEILSIKLDKAKQALQLCEQEIEHG